MTNYADMKAMLADAGVTLEMLSPAQYAEAMREIEWPPCPPRAADEKPHCPDCSGIV